MPRLAAGFQPGNNAVHLRAAALQDRLPLNPQKLAAVSPHLAFNTAASFVTNTNWQSYGGESTMSYFSQMVALVIQNFFPGGRPGGRGGAGPRHRAARDL